MTDETSHDDALHARLRTAADDSGRPLSTDVGELLGRAQRSRRRHRAGVGAAVVLTGAALVGTTVGVRAALPERAPVAEQSGASGAATSTSAAVPAADVVERCTPQLAKYDDLPQYAPLTEDPTWDLTHRGRDYHPGDVVSLREAGTLGNPVLCLLPAEGAEHEQVPFSAFDPSVADEPLLRQLCSEQLVAQPVVDPETGTTTPSDARTADLRDTTVRAAAEHDGVVAAVLGSGGKTWSCYLTPVTWDGGITDVHPSSRASYQVQGANGTTGSAHKSVVPENVAWYLGAGTMPEQAATVEYSVEGGATWEVPVTDGSYAFVHGEQTTAGVQATSYRVLDADGSVLLEERGQP